MLDTGIDIPEIVNLVFFKPVRSRTKFWQMVGRGTRPCNNLFGPGRDKPCFWIFDLCQNLEFFLGQGGAESTAPPETLSTRLFNSRLALINTIDQAVPAGPAMALPTSHHPSDDPLSALRQHRHTLAELLRCHVAACPADNFLVRPHLELVERFSQPQAWSQLSPDDHERLASTLAPLPSAYAAQQGDTDADARRFDLFLYTLQLALLRGEARFSRLQQQLQALAGQLEARANVPQVAAELELLRDLLSHGIGSEQAIARATQECNGFGLFIRSLVGLDRNAAKELFADFLADGTHTATQIRFINAILDELTSRGVMDPARLYDPPFSDLAPMGPEDLFCEADVDRICHLLDLIQTRASVPQAA